MLRCILVPLDGTPFGEQALPHAVTIARQTGATLHLAHVHLPPIVPSGAETAALPPVWIEMSWEEKNGYVTELAHRIAATAGIRVETRVMEGNVVSALERYARRCGAGLLVMSTHGHAGLSRLWHHGIADQLARDLPLPVLLVRPPERGPDHTPDSALPISHILIALDGTADSELIIEHAVAIGTPFGARYTLARVVLPETLRLGRALDARGAEVERGARASRLAARQYLNALAERLRSRTLDGDVVVLTGGDAARTILEYLCDWRVDPDRRADLIALESPDRGTVTRLFFRDTADELIRDAPVPILHFRATPKDGADPVTLQPGVANGA